MPSLPTLGRAFEKIKDGRDALTGIIHEGLRLNQKRFFSGDSYIKKQALGFSSGAATVKNIDQTIDFTAAKATELKHVTTPTAGPSTPGMPGWVWPVLAAAALLLLILSLELWKLARRLRPLAYFASQRRPTPQRRHRPHRGRRLHPRRRRSDRRRRLRR